MTEFTGSTIVISYDGDDITSHVLPPSVRFESQINAVPGQFQMTIKDVAHTHSFVTGKKVTLTVDGTVLYEGFLLQIERTYPFAAMDTTTIDPIDVPRYFTLRGVDLNRILDFRVTRYLAHLTQQIPNFDGDDQDGDLIKLMVSTYLDAADVDTTNVDNIKAPFNSDSDPAKKGAWLQQGSTMRKQIEDWTQFTGGIFYIAPGGLLHHHAIEDSVSRWGFSDAPSGGTITGSTGYQDVTIGPREITATEAGDKIVNDAFVWGGSQLAGGTGATVFARETNTDSRDLHGLWQYAETHIGEEGYKLQEGVDVRADVIVNGPPGAVGADQNRGLRYPQWNIKLVWFAHEVPTISGVPDHLKPGMLTTIVLQVFEESGDALVQLLPLRSVTISMPTIDKDGNGYVRFEGTFALQPDDPYSLWRFLLRNKGKITGQVTVVDDTSDATVYGAYGNFTPTPDPDGSTTVFTIPFGYILGTTELYLRLTGETGARLLAPDVDYTESDSIAGEITMTTAPSTGDALFERVRTLAS